MVFNIIILLKLIHSNGQKNYLMGLFNGKIEIAFYLILSHSQDWYQYVLEMLCNVLYKNNMYSWVGIHKILIPFTLLNFPHPVLEIVYNLL